jgi:hypothetical protein
MKLKHTPLPLLAFVSSLAMSTASFASDDEADQLNLQVPANTNTFKLFKELGSEPAVAVLEKASTNWFDREKTAAVQKKLDQSRQEAFHKQETMYVNIIEEADKLHREETNDLRAQLGALQDTIQRKELSKIQKKEKARLLEEQRAERMKLAEEKRIADEAKTNEIIQRINAKKIDQVKTGSLTASSVLCRDVVDDKEALMWGFVQMLTSFGQIFPYQEMQTRALALQIARDRKLKGDPTADVLEFDTNDAFMQAATWLNSNYYMNPILEKPNDGIRDLTRIFNDYLAKGNVTSFFAHTMAISQDKPRVQYMNFFKHAGIESANPTGAYLALRIAADLDLGIAKEIKGILDFLENPTAEAKLKLVKLLEEGDSDASKASNKAKSSNKYRKNKSSGNKKAKAPAARSINDNPMMRNVYEVLTGKALSEMPKYNELKDVIPALRTTLNLDK